MADGDGVGGRTGPTMPAEQIAMPPAVAHPNGCRELGPSRRAMQEHRSPAMAVETVEGDMRLGLVGYGFGGRFFHAPFIVAAEDVELVGVVTRSPQRRAELARDYPGIPAFDSQAALIAAGVDAVTITTPPETRRELVLEAVAAGVHVIADKPFAPTADDGRALVAAAAHASVVLNVFHNRRWDADIRTLAAVLSRGDVGELWRVESRFDADDPATLGTPLRDLGSHLVDQALWLLGPAQSIYADLEWVDLLTAASTAGSAWPSPTSAVSTRA